MGGTTIFSGDPMGCHLQMGSLPQSHQSSWRRRIRSREEKEEEQGRGGGGQNRLSVPIISIFVIAVHSAATLTAWVVQRIAAYTTAMTASLATPAFNTALE